KVNITYKYSRNIIYKRTVYIKKTNRILVNSIIGDMFLLFLIANTLIYFFAIFFPSKQHTNCLIYLALQQHQAAFFRIFTFFFGFDGIIWILNWPIKRGHPCKAPKNPLKTLMNLGILTFNLELPILNSWP